MPNPVLLCPVPPALPLHKPCWVRCRSGSNVFSKMDATGQGHGEQGSTRSLPGCSNKTSSLSSDCKDAPSCWYTVLQVKPVYCSSVQRTRPPFRLCTETRQRCSQPQRTALVPLQHCSGAISVQGAPGSPWEHFSTAWICGEAAAHCPDA